MTTDRSCPGAGIPDADANLRVFPNHRPALAGLTKSAPPDDDFQAPAAEAVHAPDLLEGGGSERPAPRCGVFPNRRRDAAISRSVGASGSEWTDCPVT